jgi:hypothetical protein
MWTESLWNQYPKHLMEKIRHWSPTVVETLPLRPKMERKVRPHRQTAIARKNYKVVNQTDLSA